MRKSETRPTEVFYCDGCGDETTHSHRCAVCKQEYCMADGGKKHFAFGIELYRYGDANRLYSHICNGCAVANPNLTVQQLMDGMMGKTPVVRPKAA